MSDLPVGTPQDQRTAPTSAFVDRVMSDVAVSTRPSTTRSFVDAARERSMTDGVGALVVAAHLSLRGHVPRAVRAQALALVIAVAVMGGAGVTLAATAAVHVAAPVIGLDGRGEGPILEDAMTPPVATPTPGPVAPPTPAHAVAPTSAPGFEATDAADAGGGKRLPWSHHASIDRTDDSALAEDDAGGDDDAASSTTDRSSRDGDETARDAEDGSSGDDPRDGADSGGSDDEATHDGDDAEDGHGDGDATATETPDPTEEPDATETPDHEGDGGDDSESSGAATEPPGD